MAVRLRPPIRNIVALQNFKAMNNIFDWGGEGDPVDGTTGKGVLGTGSSYLNMTNGHLFYNVGTIASPTWERS